MSDSFRALTLRERPAFSRAGHVGVVIGRRPDGREYLAAALAFYGRDGRSTRAQAAAWARAQAALPHGPPIWPPRDSVSCRAIGAADLPPRRADLPPLVPA